MSYADKTFWGIHGGRTGDADGLFLRKKYVGLGWGNMPNLTTLKPSREAFKDKIAEVYPNAKPGAIPNNAGQLFRFLHEMTTGDLIIYPSNYDKRVHIGEIIGDYEYTPEREKGYPHQREVKWIADFPRTQFSQGALYEIGTSMSFFQVKNYSDEFIAALEGKSDVMKSGNEDETISYVANDIQLTTRDFIIKQLERELKGHGLAEFVAHLLQQMGYRTRVSPPGPDAGIDIIAHRDELGFEPPIIKVQVKSTSNNIGAPDVQALYGNIDQSEFGLFVSISSYTNPAKNFAMGKSNLRLIDGDELIDLVLRHYDKFDSKYKGLIPLQRVFIPQAIEESEE